MQLIGTVCLVILALAALPMALNFVFTLGFYSLFLVPIFAGIYFLTQMNKDIVGILAVIFTVCYLGQLLARQGVRLTRHIMRRAGLKKPNSVVTK